MEWGVKHGVSAADSQRICDEEYRFIENRLSNGYPDSNAEAFPYAHIYNRHHRLHGYIHGHCLTWQAAFAVRNRGPAPFFYSSYFLSQLTR